MALEFPIKLEFGNVDFWGGRKTGEPGEKPSEQGREPTTNSTHIRRQVRESNPGHIGGRRALSPLRHPCSPIPIQSLPIQSDINNIKNNRTTQALDIRDVISIHVQNKNNASCSDFQRGYLNKSHGSV